MGEAADEVRNLLSGGVEGEVDEPALIAAVEAAAEGLDPAQFKEDLAALDAAISTNNKIKTAMAIVKMGLNLGMKLV